MNPEVALPDPEVELYSTVIDVYVDVLQQQEVNLKKLRLAQSAAILACDSIADFRENGWHDVLNQECISRGIAPPAFTRYERHREYDRAYACVTTPRSFEDTVPNRIALLLSLTSEE